MRHSPTATSSPSLDAARIGPNSVIQTVTALRERYGQAQADAILRSAGHSDLLTALPTTMIDEREFLDLIRALRAQLGLDEAGAVLARAGERTADYLLANRIPAPARVLLRLLPARPALRLLLVAISGHAWTFAGSGRFSYTLGRAPVLALVDCVECRDTHADAPICRYYAATFTGLLRALVHPRVRVVETACGACGRDRCEFAILFS